MVTLMVFGASAAKEIGDNEAVNDLSGGFSSAEVLTGT